MECIKYSYEDIELRCKKIYEDIKKSNFDVEYILGISVGGLFPSIILSRLLDTKNLCSIALYSYSGKERKEINVVNLPDKSILENKNILIVDDISDSGKTLEFLINLLKTKYLVKNIKTATIFVNEINCKLYLDYYYEKITNWVDFPWDKFEKK